MTHIGGYPGNYNKNILPIIKEKNRFIYLWTFAYIKSNIRQEI